MSTQAEIIPLTAPADDVPGPLQGNWTYDDYAAIPHDGRRYEVAEGVLYMTPAPVPYHQQVVLRIALYLHQYAEERKAGLVFPSPIDVELSPRNVLQPDVVFVRHDRENAIGPTRILGAPDLVVEVTSPGSETYDRNEKLRTYGRAGVSEYWIVGPDARIVELLVYDAKSLRLKTESVVRDDAKIPSRVLPGFPTPGSKFFA